MTRPFLTHTPSSPRLLAFTERAARYLVGNEVQRAYVAEKVRAVKEREIQRDKVYWSEPTLTIVETLLDHMQRSAPRTLGTFRESAFRGNDRGSWYETQALHAIERCDRDQFVTTISEWLGWNHKRVKDESNLDRSGFFYCIPALACCVLALDKAVVQRHELPTGNVYLPLGLWRE